MTTVFPALSPEGWGPYKSDVILALAKELWNLEVMLAPILLALVQIVLAQSQCESARVSLQDLSTAANNSYFLKWRPRFHVGAPNSWHNGSQNNSDQTC